jgi:hypothetical protein
MSQTRSNERSLALLVLAADLVNFEHMAKGFSQSSHVVKITVFAFSMADWPNCLHEMSLAIQRVSKTSSRVNEFLPNEVAKVSQRFQTSW